MKRLSFLSVLLALSCGSSDSSSTPDAPPSPMIDAAETVDSSSPGVDAASSTDGPVSAIDAAASIDVAVLPIDASGVCNGVGTTCSTSCPAGLFCYVSGGGGVCAPMRPGCGGFAGAMCTDPAAPICMYLTGADYGLCVDATEHDCICAGAPATVVDC